MRDLRVAAWPAAMPPGAPEREPLRRRLTEAAARDADLLLVPELVLSGKPVQAVDLDAPPAWWRAVLDAARDHGVWLATSILRRHGAAARNSFVLVAADGTVAGHQDKIHLWDREARSTEPGTDVRPIPTPWGPVGGLVCYDVQFPELARSLARDGADWLLVPAAIYSELGWDLSTRGRALENGCFVVGANRVGSDTSGPFAGSTRIVDPFGRVAAEAADGQQDLVLADLKAADVAAARAYAPFLRDLRWPPRLERDPTS